VSEQPEAEELSPAALARRNRTQQLASDIGDLVKDIYDRMTEMSIELDVAASDIKELITDHLDEVHRMGFYHLWADLFPAQAYQLDRGSPMRMLIGRLFKDAPKMTDGAGKPVQGQAPALGMCIVFLKAGAQVQGALSITPEGTLRMMVPNQIKTPDGALKNVMLEQFFTVEDVAMIVVPREMPNLSRSSIIQSSH
jgi:hypothetical protein